MLTQQASAAGFQFNSDSEGVPFLFCSCGTQMFPHNESRRLRALPGDVYECKQCGPTSRLAFSTKGWAMLSAPAKVNVLDEKPPVKDDGGYTVVRILSETDATVIRYVEGEAPEVCTVAMGGCSCPDYTPGSPCAHLGLVDRFRGAGKSVTAADARAIRQELREKWSTAITSLRVKDMVMDGDLVSEMLLIGKPTGVLLRDFPEMSGFQGHVRGLLVTVEFEGMDE